MQKTQQHETGYAVKGSSRENSIFHSKTHISSTQIPNLIENNVYRFHIQHNNQNNTETCIKQHNSSHHINYHKLSKPKPRTQFHQQSKLYIHTRLSTRAVARVIYNVKIVDKRKIITYIHN